MSNKPTVDQQQSALFFPNVHTERYNPNKPEKQQVQRTGSIQDAKPLMRIFLYNTSIA